MSEASFSLLVGHTYRIVERWAGERLVKVTRIERRTILGEEQIVYRTKTYGSHRAWATATFNRGTYMAKNLLEVSEVSEQDLAAEAKAAEQGH